MAKIKAGKKESKKEVIVKKAAMLFRKNGFTSTSMQHIAAELGVEAPSLYNHITGKAQLLQSICFAVGDDFTAHWYRVKNSSETVSQKLELLIKLHIRKITTDFNEVFVANHEWKQLKGPFLKQFILQRQAYENFMIELIAEGVKLKAFKTIHPKVAALSILYTIRGIEYWKRKENILSNKEIEENIINHLLFGLIQ
ncbi:MAG: TetR family transcriptional regulator [Chitinophagaceae bacterium]|nr:TetR family transcriptional regulator [Chitinophagaceae bacterium]MBK8773872.1 TetR family transcriptional regulator [Chitinophagaceae bacterium]MBK9957041.1 TetR family transcriptional regulator [Chitinophagaceae bacterium]